MVEALAVESGDSVRYTIDAGFVSIRRVDAAPEVEDQALLPFLDMLERDLKARPARAQAMPKDLRRRITNALRQERLTSRDDTIVGPVTLAK